MSLRMSNKLTKKLSVSKEKSGRGDWAEGRRRRATGSVRDGRGGGDPETTPEPEGCAGNHRGKHRRHSHQEHHGQPHHHTVRQPHAQLHLEGPEHRARN